MKTRKFISTLLICSMVSLGFLACSDDDDDDVQPTNNNNNNNNNGVTISEQIAANAELDSLEVAIAYVGLKSSLESSGNYTVFGLSNQAFRDLLQEYSVQRVSHLADTTLMDLLEYHISSEAEYKSADLNGRMYINSMNSSGPNNTQLSIQVNGNGGSIELNGKATVIHADIEASNGVVHIIDNYLDKPTILTFLEVDGRFDSLLILVRNNLYSYENTFSTGIRTVFAPDNQAFEAYINSEGNYNQISDINILTIPAFLDYHYIASANIQSGQMSDGQTLSTKQGSDLTVDLTNGLQLTTSDTTQSNVNVSETDIQASNGVLHRVDAVLKY